LIEALAHFDDGIAEKYLEGMPVTENELHAAVRKATLLMQFIGIIPGIALKNKGVQILLDAVVHYLPNPLDLLPVRAFNDDGSGEETSIVPDDSGNIAALAFKLMTDPSVGKLMFCRACAGQLKRRSGV
jgi:elongation factor G